MPNYTKTVRTSTKRQRESQRAQAQRERHAALVWLRKLVLIVCVAGLVLGGGVGVYLWHDEPVLARAGDAIHRTIDKVSVRSGLVVKQVVLQGRGDTPIAKIKASLGVSLGDPMLAVSLRSAQERLEALPEIRSARLSRLWPDVISVSIEEREPAARWRRAGEEVLIDRDGLVLGDKKASDYPHVMLFVGEEVGTLAPAFFAMCEAEPVLCEQVIGAKRVGGRRWDVGLQGGLVAKLPEKNAAQAWQQLAQMEEEKLISPYLSVIDLRLTDRIFVTRARGKGIVAAE